jgi:HEAT repeat protein
MSSTNSNLQTAASIAVLSSQPANADAKAIVVRLGLANASWEIRKNSVVALSKATLGPSEENALLGMLADSDKDVRAEAVLAASKMKVSEKHIAKVRELAGNSLWETRAQAVSLLARIGTEMAVGILIEKMEDVDSDVRNAVREALSKQTLKESHVAALAAHLKSGNWEVRRAALALIGTINGQTATNELIKALNDSDSDARAEAFQQLYGRKLGSDSVAPLAKQFESDSFEVRVSVAKLLGKIKSKSSVEALKKQLAKETDEDVKTQIKASMKTAKP